MRKSEKHFENLNVQRLDPEAVLTVLSVHDHTTYVDKLRKYIYIFLFILCVDKFIIFIFYIYIIYLFKFSFEG